MAYSPYPISRFGGLRLDVEPEQIGAQDGCIDCLNVDFNRPGAARTRDGLAKFNSVAGTDEFYDAVVWTRPGTASQVIVSDMSGDLYAYSTAGVVGNNLAASCGSLSAASLGTPTAGPYLYIGGGAALHRFDGTNFSSPASQPVAKFVATQPTDNRLVVANATLSGTGNTSRVHFSDANAPETWTANNFVDLHPNDGGAITGMVTWRDQIFVFKSTGKLFVFYGNSTDSANNPIFNYRTVDMGLAAGVDEYSVVAAEEGVYFRGRAGIYLTTGNTPRKISESIDPLFVGGLDSSHPFTAFDSITAERLGQRPVVWGKRVLFPVRVRVGTPDPLMTLVYYRDTEEWSVWDHGAAFDGGAGSIFWLYPVGSIANGDVEQGRCLWVHRATTKHLYETSTLSTDDGTNFVSRYRSGFYTVGNQPTQEVVVRESMLEGIGTPTYSVSKDYAAVPTTGGGAKAAVTLGTSPAYDNGWHTVDQEGRRFSYQIESTSGAWRVNSITHHILGIQTPGAEAA